MFRRADAAPATYPDLLAVSHRTPGAIVFPPTTGRRFDAATFELGLTQMEAAPGEDIRVYHPARTVADLMRLRHRTGEPLALAALHRYLRRRDARPGELLEIAAALDAYGPVLRAIDVASAGCLR